MRRSFTDAVHAKARDSSWSLARPRNADGAGDWESRPTGSFTRCHTVTFAKAADGPVLSCFDFGKYSIGIHGQAGATGRRLPARAWQPRQASSPVVQ